MIRTFLSLLIVAGTAQPVAALARTMPEHAVQVSDWAKSTQSKLIRSYFPEYPAIGSEEKDILKADLARLVHEYKNLNPSPIDQQFVHTWLWPLIDNLTAESLQEPLANQPLPFMDMTVDQVLGAELWMFLMHGHPDAINDPTFLLNAFNNMKTQPPMSMKGKLMIVAVGASVLSFLSYTGKTLIVTSPLTSISNAVLDPFLGPVLEKIRVTLNGSLGPLKGRFTNWLNRKELAHEGSDYAFKTRRDVKFASLANIYNDMGGMTASDQLRNMTRLMKIFTDNVNIYGGLFVDTHHHGRGLLDHIMDSELEAAIAVQSINSVIHQARNQDMIIAQGLVTVARLKGDHDRVVEIYDLIDRYQETLQIKDFNQYEPKSVEERLYKAAELENRMMELGFSEYEVSMLRKQQMQVEKATIAKATALAMLELSNFGRAEGNRNANMAQRVAVALRKNFGLQEESNEVRILMQQIIRLMGFTIEGTAEPPPPLDNELYQCVENRYLDDNETMCKDLFKGKSEDAFMRKNEPFIEDLVKQMLTWAPNDLYDKLRDVTDPDLRERLARHMAKRFVANRKMTMDQLRHQFTGYVFKCLQERVPYLRSEEVDDSKL